MVLYTQQLNVRKSWTTNLGFSLLLLHHTDDFLAGLFGDILVVPSPADLGVR